MIPSYSGITTERRNFMLVDILSVLKHGDSFTQGVKTNVSK